MAGKIRISRLRKFDIAEYLDDEEMIAAYLNDAMETANEQGSASALNIALGNVARARGMSEIARRSGLSRESLYKALASEAQPRFDTIQRVFASMNMKITLVPADEPAATGAPPKAGRAKSARGKAGKLPA